MGGSAVQHDSAPPPPQLAGQVSLLSSSQAFSLPGPVTQWTPPRSPPYMDMLLGFVCRKPVVPTLPPPARQEGGMHAGVRQCLPVFRHFFYSIEKKQGKSRFALCCWTISLDVDEVLIWWAHLQEYHKYPSIVIVIYSLQPYTYLVVQPGDDTLDNGSSAAGDIHVQAVYCWVYSVPLTPTFIRWCYTNPSVKWCYTSVLTYTTVVLHQSPPRPEVLQN